MTTLAARRGFAWRLGLTLWLVLLVHYNPDGAAGARFVYLVRAIVERHVLFVDAYAARSYKDLLPADVFTRDGHVWIDTNPGLALLATPAWAVAVALARLAARTDALLREPLAFLVAHLVTTATTTMLATVATALLLFRWVRRSTGDAARGVFAALLYTLGTNVFFLSTLLLQHSLIALAALILFLAVFDREVLGAPFAGARGEVLLGVVAGGAVLVDLSIVPALALLGPLLVAEGARRAGRIAGARPIRGAWAGPAGRLLAGAAGPLLVLILYQQLAFGNALYPAQHYYFAGQVVAAHGFMQLPRAGTLAEILVGPRAGLLLFVPASIPALWLLARTVRAEQRAGAGALGGGREATVAAALVGVYVLWASAFPAALEYAVFGPRYLSPVLPLLCAWLARYAARLTGPGMLLAIGASFAVNVAGAQNGLYATNVFRVVALWGVRGPWVPAIDQLRGELGVQSAAAAGPLLALLGALVVLWTPFLLATRADEAVGG